MCGIIGYTGNKPAKDVLIRGLQRLQYRGYDSSGVYVSGSSDSHRAVGPIEELQRQLPHDLVGQTGIGHTRWATHGHPTLVNAHPHHDQRKRIWVVHNGVIDNHGPLRDELVRAGHTFLSHTDSEVIAHLIGRAYDADPDLPRALASALARVRGTYGLIVASDLLPGTLLVARDGSPVVIGCTANESIVASDVSPILEYVNDVVYLREREYAVVQPGSCNIFSYNHEPRALTTEHLDFTLDHVEKGAYPHYMFKEIMEIPDVLETGLAGRIDFRTGSARLRGIHGHVTELAMLERLTIVGCGSAYYAGIVGKLLFEGLAGIPTQVEIGSEYRHRQKFDAPGSSALIAISQSGETGDTLACVRDAQRSGLMTIGVVNVEGSSIARETTVGVYTRAGPELGVASTKAFVSQLHTLTLMAIYLGRLRGSLSEGRGATLIHELRRLPEKVRSILARRDKIQRLAEEYLGYDDFLFIGRGYNYPTAYEGALKLKEVSYVHAEGYGAGELRHGPIAMIDDIFPTIAIVPRDELHDVVCANIEEIRARSGRVLAIATEGDYDIRQQVDDVFYIPDTSDVLTPILVSIPLQLFAYYSGVLRGFNVDRPRNLAKM